MPKLSKNKAARAQYKAKLEANRKAKEKAKKEAIKLTEQEKKDRQNELARQRRAKKKAELTKQLQKQREQFCFNSLQLPYNELLQHSLLAYLFSRNITGTGLCKGVRDNSLNLAIRIGLINTKFASMANTTFLKQNNGILRAFFLDSLKQYAKENDYFYEEATDKTQEEVINLYINRIFRTFQSTHQYFCASQAHHNNKKINDLITEGAKIHVITGQRLKVLQKRNLPKEYYAPITDNPIKRTDLIISRMNEGVLFTENDVIFFNEQLRENCEKYGLTLRRYYYGKVSEETKALIYQQALLNTMLRIKKNRRNINSLIIYQLPERELVDCIFFPSKALKTLEDTVDKSYISENLHLIRSQVATRSIIEGYKRYQTKVDKEHGKEQYETYTYHHFSRVFTLSGVTIEQLDKIFFLLIQILNIFPAPIRMKRETAEYDWKHYFFDKKADFYYFCQIDNHTRIRNLKKAQLTIDNIRLLTQTLSEILTPIFCPLDFPEIYEALQRENNQNNQNNTELSDIRSLEAQEITNYTFQQAQEILQCNIRNIITMEGDNLFTDVINLLECYSYILDKFIATEEEQQTFAIQTLEQSLKSKPTTQQEMAVGASDFINPYPEVDW